MTTVDENWRVFDFIINYFQCAFESCSRLLINMTRKPYKTSRPNKHHCIVMYPIGCRYSFKRLIHCQTTFIIINYFISSFSILSSSLYKNSQILKYNLMSIANATKTFYVKQTMYFIDKQNNVIFTTPFDGFGNACFLRRHFYFFKLDQK